MHFRGSACYLTINPDLLFEKLTSQCPTIFLLLDPWLPVEMTGWFHIPSSSGLMPSEDACSPHHNATPWNSWGWATCLLMVQEVMDEVARRWLEKKGTFLDRIWRSLQNATALSHRCDAFDLWMQPSKIAVLKFRHIYWFCHMLRHRRFSLQPRVTVYLMPPVFVNTVNS